MSLQDFIDTRLVAFRDRTRMWGSNEAIELQAIQLIEIEFLDASTRLNRPRLVFDAYVNELRRIHGTAVQPLYQLVDDSAFGEALFHICAQLRAKLRAEIG